MRDYSHKYITEYRGSMAQVFNKTEEYMDTDELGTTWRTDAEKKMKGIAQQEHQEDETNQPKSAICTAHSS